MNYRNILMTVMESNQGLKLPVEVVAKLMDEFEQWKREKYKNKLANDAAKAALEETLPTCLCEETLGKDVIDCPIHGAMSMELYVLSKDTMEFQREITDFEKRWYKERGIELKDETPTPPSLY